MKTNWYIDNNVVPSLGTAILLLEGTNALIVSALRHNDPVILHKMLIYGHDIVTLYNKSVLIAPKGDLTTMYLIAGEKLLREFLIIAKHSSKLLQSKIRLIYSGAGNPMQSTL